MRRSLLLAYQLLTGLSDSSTGLLLIFAPLLTLRLMGLQAASETVPFLSYIGAFVLSVGIACLYGGLLVLRNSPVAKLETVWMLTGITRSMVALYVGITIVEGAMARGWSTVALTDGAIAVFQFVGLARGWLHDTRS
jgi:hypothetical protein